MNTYEILDNENNVINVIVADEDFVQQHHAGRHRLYEPPAQVISPKPRLISKVDFRFRLTDAEYAGILSAAKTDVTVQAWVETFNMVSEVDLDSQRTEDGIDMMISKSLIAPERKADILASNELAALP